MRAPQGAFFNCGHLDQFARECPAKDQVRKPMTPVVLDDQMRTL